jgi:hypothetical protein
MEQQRRILKRLAGMTLTVACLCFLSPFFAALVAQTSQTTAVRANPMPRTPDGKPDFSGVWQAITTAHQDIQDHSASVAGPPGTAVVAGNELPYQPWALEQRKKNFANREKEDLTEAQCWLPGVPRATYMPYPFQIIQNAEVIGIRYTFARALRIIRVNGKSRDHLEGWPDFWMGDSRATWEGDALVVDVRKLDERTWFDHAGNFHSDALHVVERYSPIDRDHIQYEATIDDPKVFSRPWKISMPLYRLIDNNVRVMEWDCAYHRKAEQYKDAKPLETQK